MVKHLKGADVEREAFLDSLFFSLHYHTLLPLAVTMFQKYRKVCPDKLGLLKSPKKKWNVSETMRPEYMFRAFFRNLCFLEKAERFLGISKKRGLSTESAVTESATDTALSTVQLLLHGPLENRHEIALYYYNNYRY